MLLFKNLLLLCGTLLLCISLWPVRRMIVPLPEGRIRLSWFILFFLVCFFIVGYLVFTALHWDIYRGPADLIVPLVFFFGAVFVVQVCLLSLQTAEDLKRIFVLERESTTDSLMGIYNRRYFDRRLNEEFVRSTRYKEPLSLIMIDVDRFKNVNDRWGHQIGDLVLQRLAELIEGSLREADVVCRYGGEELVIILPHTNGPAAKQLAEKIRRKIERTEMVTEDMNPRQEALRITISLGVASLSEQIVSVDVLLAQSDQALYLAKQAGRNRVVCCPDIESNNLC